MTKEMKDDFVNRINTVKEEDKALFGKMNVSQMICHCADQFRMMFGEVKGLKRQNVDLVKLKEMSLRKETLPTVDGLDQVAGEGTKPTIFEDDKKILIQYLEKYYVTDDEFIFSFHPYYESINKQIWERLIIHHLNHHLSQFNR